MKALLGLGFLASCFALLVTALAAAPANAAEDPYEPNDSAPAAAGPLLFAQAYQAVLQSSIDRDFYFFYVTSPSATEVSLTAQNLGGGGNASDITVTISDPDATPVASQTFIRGGEARVVTATLEPQKYYLEVSLGTGFGDSYSLVAGGGEGAFGPYAQISSRCAKATAAAQKSGSRLNRLESKLQRTTARLRRSRYVGRQERRRARVAQQKVSVATCSGPGVDT